MRFANKLYKSIRGRFCCRLISEDDNRSDSSKLKKKKDASKVQGAGITWGAEQGSQLETRHFQI